MEIRRNLDENQWEGSIAMSKMDRITVGPGEPQRDEKMSRCDKEQAYYMENAEKVLQIGRICMQDAEQCEMKSDYIGAASLYRMCSEMFASVMKEDSDCREAAKSEYMHTLFRQAMLPQTRKQEKMAYLEEAQVLAAELERQTEEIEYMIAGESIREELEILSRTLEQNTFQKQRDEIQFV